MRNCLWAILSGRAQGVASRLRSRLLPMFRRIDLSRLALHALAKYLPLALAYLVIVRRPARCRDQFSSRILLTKSAGMRSVDEGVLNPMYLAISATKALQLYAIAFHVRDSACNCLI